MHCEIKTTNSFTL